MSKIMKLIRSHRVFLIVTTVLTLVMTWPTIIYVFRTDVFWLPTEDYDVWMKFWDAWYGFEILSGRAEYTYTNLLFYPNGLSLDFHLFSIPHMLVFGLMQGLLPTSNAYCITYLLIVLSVTITTYIYLLYVLKDRWIALLGAVIVGFSPFVVGHPHQPDINSIATVPLSLYFFHRGWAEHRHKLVLFAAVIAGLTAYVGMYILVCLALTVGMFAIAFLAKNWRCPAYWLTLGASCLIVGLISAPRVLPIIHNNELFDEVINKTEGRESGNDLIEYFANVLHPTAGETYEQISSLKVNPPYTSHTSYIGYTVLVLIGIGLVGKIYRRRMIPWLLLLIPFLVLRLGSSLTIAGVQYEHILLLKAYLDDLVPGIFESFHATDHFQMAILIPLAILASYGLLTLARSLSPSKRQVLVILAIVLVSFEYWQEIKPTVISDSDLAFLEWLETEPEPKRLVHVPMSRQNSKLYNFYQTFNGFPYVEGLANRTPSQAYEYIKKNFLLNAWHEKNRIYCHGEQRMKYLSALSELESDGFSHIIFHRSLQGAKSIGDSFRNIAPSYRDETVSVFRLGDLRDSCG